MSDAPRDMLCRALDMEQKARDFYDNARGNCPSQLGRAVFDLLAEDKTRLAARLTAIHAALNQGQTWERACVMDEDDTGVTSVFNELAARHGGETQVCKLELDLLLKAQEVESSCLKFLEDQLRAASDPGVRAFLQRAMEEERGHFVLLSDMRLHYEQASETVERNV